MMQQVVMDQMPALPSQKLSKAAKSKDSSEFQAQLSQMQKLVAENPDDPVKPETKEAKTPNTGAAGGVFDLAMVQGALQIMGQLQTAVQDGLPTPDAQISITEMPKSIGMQGGFTELPQSTGTQTPVTESPQSIGIPMHEVVEDSSVLWNLQLPSESVQMAPTRLRPNVSQAMMGPTDQASIQTAERRELGNQVTAGNIDEALRGSINSVPAELLGESIERPAEMLEELFGKAIGQEARVAPTREQIQPETAFRNIGTELQAGLQELVSGQDASAQAARQAIGKQMVLGSVGNEKRTVDTDAISGSNALEKLSGEQGKETDAETKIKNHIVPGWGLSKPEMEPMMVGAQTAGKLEHAFRTVKQELPVSEQITQKILVHQAQEKEFVLQLFPKELGQVTVKMAVEQRNLVVELCASNPKAQSVILSHAEEIKSILQAQYQRDTQVLVPTPQEKGTEHFQNQNQNHSRQNQQEHQQQQPQDEGEKPEIMFTQGFLSAMTALQNREGQVTWIRSMPIAQQKQAEPLTQAATPPIPNWVSTTL